VLQSLNLNLYLYLVLAGLPKTFFTMRFSRVFAVFAFALSGATLCQLPSAAQSVPVDFSGEVAPECEPINVTPGVLANPGGFSNALNSGDVAAGGQNGLLGRFSCNQNVEVRYDSITAPATNPIALQNLDCEVDVSGGNLGGGQDPTRCDIAGGGIPVGGGNGQIVGPAGAEVSLSVFSPTPDPMPVGTYNFTVNLSVVPN